MAVLPPKRGSQRRPALRGNIVQDTTRGVERTRAWPEKRGSRQTKGQIDQQEWFRQANWAFKLMDPKVQAIITHAAAGTSLYPRDVFSIMASGGLFAFITEDRKVAYPMATIQAVSESLDAITQNPGDTLIRGPQYWRAGRMGAKPGSLSTRIGGASTTLPSGGEFVQPWGKPVFDELGAYSPSAPERLTIPEGISRVSVGVQWGANGGGATNFQVAIRQNGTLIASGAAASGYGSLSTTVATGPINVEAGDYFDVHITMSAPANKALRLDRSGFWMVRA